MPNRLLLVTILTVTAAMPAAGGGRRDHGGQHLYSYRGGGPVRTAMYDLESAWRRARVDSHEANHFRRALGDLAGFEERAARGRFDRGRLDSAIGHMAHLAQARQLHPRDRQLIARRILELRYFRERWAAYR